MKTIIYGGEVHLEGSIIQNGYIVIENDHISKINNFSNSNLDERQLEFLLDADKPDQVINATGKIVAPGSIEFHTHGFKGKEFMDTTPGSLEEILKAYAKFGVTSVSPTIVTDTKERINEVLESVVRNHERYELDKMQGRPVEPRANLLRCHLECRYFNEGKTQGAHNSKELVNSAEKYKQKYEHNDNRDLTEIILDEIAEFDSSARGFIGVITIDPSLDGANATIKILKSKGYKIAIGHSNSTKAQAEQAINNGATILTHTFNCISQEGDYKGDRIGDDSDQKNAMGACLDSGDVNAEVVIDLVHSRGEYVSMVKERKKSDYIILITDACAAAGTDEKECTLGGKKVLIMQKNGHEAAYYEDETLCGSILTMDQAIRNAVKIGCSLNEAFKMASTNPAKALGINERGSISERNYADLVVYEKLLERDEKTGKLLDNIGRTLCTLIEGRIAYKTDDFKPKIKRTLT